MKTITFVNGAEFHCHEAIEKGFGVECSFVTPRNSWKSGTNENTNGSIGRCLPKGT